MEGEETNLSEKQLLDTEERLEADNRKTLPLDVREDLEAESTEK